MIEKNCFNTQKVVAHLAPQTAGGQPAEVDGVPTWTVEAGSGTVVPTADGMNCECIPDDGFVGDVDFRVSADADLGAGVTTIEDLLRLHVSNEQAQSLGFSVDEPIAK